MANQIVWVDIPVLDLDRAVRFYSAVLGSPVQKQEHPGMTIGLLPGSDPDVSGCLFTKDDERPSDRGLLIYLNARAGSTRPSPRSSRTAARWSSRSTRSARMASGP